MILDEDTKNTIDEQINKILIGMTINNPPVDLSSIVDYLKIGKKSYDLNDEELLSEIRAELRVADKDIQQIVKGIDLKGLWIPKDNVIFIDKNVTKNKKRWVEGHEISHAIIPSHRYFLLGDTEDTLDPDYRLMLEAEANYGASSLIFLGDKFTGEARDLSIEWKSVQLLSKRYGNSLNTTLRRFVQFSHDIPMAAFIGSPIWENNLNGQDLPLRSFIPSDSFSQKFSKINMHYVFTLIRNCYPYRRRGPLGESIINIHDDNGDCYEFICDSFYNSYYLMTLLYFYRKR